MKFFQKYKIELLCLLLASFFPLALLRIYNAIMKGWIFFSGELACLFPFAHKLHSYNPSLYKSLLLDLNRDSPRYLMESTQWFYGPIHHLWLFPLTYFAPSVSWFFNPLLVFYLVLIFLLLFLLYRSLFDTRNIVLLLAFMTIALGSMQMSENLVQRNVELLEVSLIIIAYLCIKNNKHMLGGGILGLAAMAKFLPFLFVPYLLVKRKTKAVVGFLIVFICIAVLGQLVLGWENNELFTSWQKLHRFGAPLTALGGQPYIVPISHLRGSFYTFILSFFASIDMSSYIPIVTYKINDFIFPNILFFILSGIIFFSSFYLFYKKKNGDLFFEFSIVGLLMLLLSPRTNPHYYIFSLFAFLSVFKFLVSSKYKLSSSSFTFIGGLFFLLLLLMGHLIPFSVYEIIFPLENAAFHYFSTYSIFGMGAFLLWCLMMYLGHKLDRV
ncbi:MAG: DUF2029 domain-containing protein [Deltaproteobacteria bacterium]|nr:DUF2029 domain-containing protein [Deltaproteobacteria bacterium]